jgi:excisionase family DNA binding protein
MFCELYELSEGLNMAELTVLEAAQVVGMNRDTVRRWCVDGLLQTRRVGLRRDWRIDIDDLRRHARQYGYDFDEKLAAELAR